MADVLFPTDQDPREQPIDEDLDFAAGDLPDDDTEVVEGLKQLVVMRAAEDESASGLRLPARSVHSVD
jgi:hypothetical protein